MSGAQPTPIPAARCVLWHPSGSPPPTDLIDAIQRRGLAWTSTDRLLSALVQTLSPPPPSPTSSHSVPTVLVLIDVPRLANVDGVLDVVSRYRPRTAFWVFDLADPTRLKSMQPLEIISQLVPPARVDAPRNRPTDPVKSPTVEPKPPPSDWRPQLKLADSTPTPTPSARPDSPPEPRAGASSNSRSFLSGDELAMLAQGDARRATS